MGSGRAGPVALWGCGMDEECALQQDGAGMLPVPPRVPSLLQGNNPGKQPRETSCPLPAALPGSPWHGISHRQTAEGAFRFLAS